MRAGTAWILGVMAAATSFGQTPRVAPPTSARDAEIPVSVLEREVRRVAPHAAEAPAPEPPRALERWGPIHGPEAPAPLGFPVDDAAQRRLAAASPGARRFLAEYPAWRVLFEPRQGAPWRAYGPGIPLAPRGADRETVAAAATVFARRLHRQFSLPGDPPTLETIARGGRLWYVAFRQAHRGVRATDAGLTLRIDVDGKLVLWGGRFPVPDALGAEPVVTLDDARLLALAHLRGRGLLGKTAPSRLVAHETVRHAPLAAPDARAALVRRLRLSVAEPRAEWEVFVDARTGEVRDCWNDVRQCAAHDGCGAHAPHLAPRAPHAPSFSVAATALVHDGREPWQTPVVAPLPDCLFQIGGAPYVTDPNGAIAYGGPAPVLATSDLDGPWIQTANLAPGAAQASYSALAAGGPLTPHFDDANSSQAERDAFFFAVRARNRVLEHNPFETLFANPLPTNTGLAGPCNAYYDGSSINFFAASGGCFDTATSATVVQHEYGHHVTATIYAAHGKTVPGHLGEAFSDLQAAFSENDSRVGRGLLGPGTYVRDLVNTCRWPYGCGTGVHARGKIAGGAWWSARQYALAAGGPAAGDAIVDALYAHFHGAPQTETESCLELLALLDDDADLTNGAPYFAELYAAFAVDHGVPFPTPPVLIDHAPLGDTADQLRAIEFRATATSILGAPVVAGWLYYSVDGAAYSSLAMTDVGGEWFVSWPRPPANAVVSYYFAFTDAFGLGARLPASAPDGAFVFRTYRPTVFYSEGFDSALGGWTSAATGGADEWHLGAPGAPAYAFDPPAPFAGPGCAGLDLAPGATFDGLYAPGVVSRWTSPPIDCTGRSFVALDYRRRLSVEDATYDQARILLSVNNGPFQSVWMNAAGPAGDDHHLDFEWVRHVVRLAAADGQPAVRVRFELASDTGQQFGGWNLDELRLDAAPATAPLAVTGVAVAGQTLVVHVRGGPGEGFVLCADVAPAAAFVPYVGAISLDPYGPGFVFVVPPDVLSLPVNGWWASSAVVPPGLTGATLWLQAVFAPVDGSPFAPSNVLSLVFL
jgi:hypothetical protein